MLKNIFVCMAVITLLTVAIDCQELDNTPIEMPEGFEKIQIGISINELMKIRPSVKRFGFDIDGPPQNVDLTKGDQLLIENLNGHLFFSHAMYRIQNGKLIALVLLTEEKNIQNIRNERPSFLSSCIKKWGTNFERRVVKVKPGKLRYLAPLLLWHKGQIKIGVTCTPEPKEVTLTKGFFQLDIFWQEKIDISQCFEEEKVNDEIRDELFREIGIGPSSN